MKILGISAFHPDSAACLVVDGKLVAAAQEERFSRQKHDRAFPAQALLYCLVAGGCTPAQIDLVVFHDTPPPEYDPAAILRALWGAHIDWQARLLMLEYDRTQAAAAFFPSPFDTAAVLVLGGGARTGISVAIGNGDRLTPQRRQLFPHSPGLLYSALTRYLGFKANSGEYKVMGLAPYGTPRYADLLRQHVIDLREDGTFLLDLRYFDTADDAAVACRRFERLFGMPPRRPETALTQSHMDIAASLQRVAEDIVLRTAREIARATGLKNLCLAGGTALNCVANGKLLRAGLFERIWIQPAAGEAGGAIGAALAAYYDRHRGGRHVDLESNLKDDLKADTEIDAKTGSGNSRAADGMRGALLGPHYEQAEIERRLTASGARYTVLDDDGLVDAVARALADGDAVGWHQGRMEFGPRALGARSILADPRAPGMQQRLNLKIKYRESFRPFAPSILREDLEAWFELDTDSPYMLLLAEVAAPQRRQAPMQAPSGLRPDYPAEQPSPAGIDRLQQLRSTIPAVTHVDYSARIQTVVADTHPRFHALLTRFRQLTGCPVLANTSFNVRGEPIVATPEDAFRCFMGTGLDLLAVGNCLLRKAQQPPHLQRSVAADYAPD